MPAGHFLGQQLAGGGHSWLLVPLGMLIGYFLVTAEPDVYKRQGERRIRGEVRAEALVDFIRVRMPE